ncbi:hypothetical protein [Saccharopolyspora gloriosae]|uniref:hypothetical protein n=1 Tax=Saccharopolyspora gloriosae TaxID=455344 RepID=UPI001FB6E457|nr:hypothetical protein [Saccharopolyspora gloriosae]
MTAAGRGDGADLSGEIQRARAILGDLCFGSTARHPEDRIRDHLELDPAEITELELQLRHRHRIDLDLRAVYDHTLSELAALLSRATFPESGGSQNSDR